MVKIYDLKDGWKWGWLVNKHVSMLVIGYEINAFLSIHCVCQLAIKNKAFNGKSQNIQLRNKLWSNCYSMELFLLIVWNEFGQFINETLE